MWVKEGEGQKGNEGPGMGNECMGNERSKVLAGV